MTYNTYPVFTYFYSYKEPDQLMYVPDLQKKAINTLRDEVRNLYAKIVMSHTKFIFIDKLAITRRNSNIVIGY